MPFVWQCSSTGNTTEGPTDLIAKLGSAVVALGRGWQLDFSNCSAARAGVIPTGFSTSANTTIFRANAGMGESAGAALTIDDDIELPDRGLGGGVALKLPGVGYGVQASAGRLASANLASHPYALVRKLMLNNCTP